MEQLLKQLLTVNNDNRSRGEGALAELEKHPESYITSLVSVIHTSSLSSVRNLACILMRQKLNTGEDGVWDKLSPAYQTSVKAQLLQLLENEKELNIREKICQCIGELGLSRLEVGDVLHITN
ncbi:hypothetical protein BLSTO_05957 [Blastocystis sp. subtype 1]